METQDKTLSYFNPIEEQLLEKMVNWEGGQSYHL